MRFIPKDSQEGFRWITRAIIVAMVLLVVYELAVQKPAQPYKQPVFSSYNNSCYNLEQAIKKTMNDPDSYEHVETTHQNNGITYHVVTTFRGKNALGAKVLNMAEATVDTAGRVLNWKVIR